MKVSDYVIKFLKEKGIEAVFGYQGGSVTHLIDSTAKYGVTYVQAYHEQGAAFAANGYAQVSGRFGVAIACSGPGATNLVTGIANAFFDSIPCMFITGQVSTHEMKRNQNIRQNGFQETDIVSIVTPITKYAITIKEPDQIRYELEKAYYYMKEGRAGSVLLDIPHNVQGTDIDVEALAKFEVKNAAIWQEDESKIRQLVEIRELIRKSKRPVFLVGGGARDLKDSGEFEKIIKQYEIPVVASLRGLDIVPHDNEWFVGFIGVYGNRYANFTVACADLVIVIGSRLDARQTGNVKEFAEHARIVHVDVDRSELGRVVERSLNLNISATEFIEELENTNEDLAQSRRDWLNTILEWKQRYPSDIDHGVEIYQNKVIKRIGEWMKGEPTSVSVDVGQNQMWVAQSIFLKKRQFLLNSAGHGAMGYALPAAIGAYFADCSKQVVCIAGDGGIQMNLQELQVLSREKIPMKIFIMNNSGLGMIRTYHEKWFQERMLGSVEGFNSPPYSKIACAFNLEYIRIENSNDYSKLDSMEADKGYIIEVILPTDTQIVPEPTPQRAVQDQTPLLSREEYSVIMEKKYEKI